VQRDCASIFAPHFSPDGLIEKALIFAEGLEHIMDFTQPRALNTLFSMLNRSVRLVLEYNEQHTDFPMSQDLLEKFLSKRLLYSLVWSFSGDCKLPLRADLGKFVLSIMKYAFFFFSPSSFFILLTRSFLPSLLPYLQHRPAPLWRRANPDRL